MAKSRQIHGAAPRRGRSKGFLVTSTKPTVAAPARRLFQTLIWNEAAVAALGELSDVKLGKVLGIASHTVQAKRRALGIPPWQPQRTAHTVTCVTCKKPFQIHGRQTRLRQTCPSTRPMHLSKCHKALIAKTLRNRQPTTLASTWKKVPGMKFLDRLDD